MFDPISSDGLDAQWSHDHGDTHASFQWDNEAWTVRVIDHARQAETVLRVSPTWWVRQVLVFRDLPEPDLWLGTDGTGRWGEVNGIYRNELDGGTDLVLAGVPVAHTLVARRLGLASGDHAEVTMIDIDLETLAVELVTARYHRVKHRRWMRTVDGTSTKFEVDDHGMVIDVDGYRRVR